MKKYQNPITPELPTPQRAFTTDSAEHLMAVSPVLKTIASWTGIIGFTLITKRILSNNNKQTKRNAVMIIVFVAVVFLLIIGFMAWLAMLK